MGYMVDKPESEWWRGCVGAAALHFVQETLAKHPDDVTASCVRQILDQAVWKWTAGQLMTRST